MRLLAACLLMLTSFCGGRAYEYYFSDHSRLVFNTNGLYESMRPMMPPTLQMGGDVITIRRGWNGKALVRCLHVTPDLLEPDYSRAECWKGKPMADVFAGDEQANMLVMDSTFEVYR